MTESPAGNSRFEIDPRRYPRDRTYIAIFTILGTLVLGFSGYAAYLQYWWIVAIGGLVFLIFPYMISQYNRGDLLEMRSDFLHVSKMNPGNAGFRIRRGRTIEITLEHVDGSGPDSDVETTATLNLWDTESGFRKRTILGFWLSREAKARVFDELVEFLTAHGFTVKSRNDVDKP